MKCVAVYKRQSDQEQQMAETTRCLSSIFYPDNIILKRSDVLNTENSRKKGGENGVLRSRPFKEAWTVTIGLLLLCRHGIL
jgi:hypothetical protein